MNQLILLFLISFFKLLSLNIQGQDWVPYGKSMLASNYPDLNDMEVTPDSKLAVLGYGTSRWGQISVFEYQSGEWKVKGTEIQSMEDNIAFGWSVSVSDDGQHIVSGNIADTNNDREVLGSVTVYTWANGDWLQKGETITGLHEKGEFGFSVDISNDGNTLVVGAHRADSERGHVNTYHFNAGTWLLHESIITGFIPFDEAGYSISLSGDGNYLAVGIPNYDGPDIYNPVTNQGGVAVYSWTPDGWQLHGPIIEGTQRLGTFGASVEISADGSKVAVGAPQNKNSQGLVTGEILEFELDLMSETWIQIGQAIGGKKEGELFGFDVAMSSDGLTIAGSGPFDLAYLNEEPGVARVYKLLNNTWLQYGSDINGLDSGDELGVAIDISGDGERLFTAASYNVDLEQGYGQSFRMGTLSTIEDASEPEYSLAINPDRSLTVEFKEINPLVQLTSFDVLGRRLTSSKCYNCRKLSLPTQLQGLLFVNIQTDSGTIRTIPVVGIL